MLPYQQLAKPVKIKLCVQPLLIALHFVAVVYIWFVKSNYNAIYLLYLCICTHKSNQIKFLF